MKLALGSFVVCLCCCTIVFFKASAAVDPCESDDSGTEVNCWRTTEEEGCLITARYDERYDPTVKCCCLCPGNRCTESGHHATQCHAEYCENAGQSTTTIVTMTTTTTTKAPSTTPTPTISTLGISTAATITTTTQATGHVVTISRDQSPTWPDSSEEVTANKTETLDMNGEPEGTHIITVIKIVAPILVILFIIVFIIAIGDKRRQKLLNWIRCRTQNNERSASNINRSSTNTNGNSQIRYSEVRTNGDAHRTTNGDVEAASLEGQPSNGAEPITRDENGLNENNQGGRPDEDTGSLVNH